MKTFLDYPAEVILLLFAVITFLQSGLDKVFDWNGNLSWLKGHFKESPFKNIDSHIISESVTLVEIVAGVLCAIGVVHLLIDGSKDDGIIWGKYFLHRPLDACFLVNVWQKTMLVLRP